MASEPDPDANSASHEKDVVSKEELSEILAEATGSTPEEIEQGAEEIDIGPPEEAEVVDAGSE